MRPLTYKSSQNPRMQATQAPSGNLVQISPLFLNPFRHAFICFYGGSFNLLIGKELSLNFPSVCICKCTVNVPI